MEVLAARARQGASSGAPALLVVDEFPCLTQETAGLPSIVQSLYDSLGPGAGAGTVPLRLILCGSAISVMSKRSSASSRARSAHRRTARDGHALPWRHAQVCADRAVSPVG
jgi:hypothetical protein